MRKTMKNKSRFKTFVFVVFCFIPASGCIKRNIFGGLGVGGGVSPEGGITKLKFSPGELDENIQGIVELGGIFRPVWTAKKINSIDFVPSVGYGIFFRFTEIRDIIFPYFGTTIDLLFFKTPQEEAVPFSVSNEFRLIIGVEYIRNKNISLFYEFPFRVGGVGVSPKFSFILGASFYIMR